MKTGIRYLLLASAAFAVFSIVYADVIRDKPVAYSNGNDIVLRWSTVDETGVQRFDIMRCAGPSGDFSVVASIDQLKGNNSTYEYVDKSVFKVSSGIYRYQIRVVFAQGSAQESAITTVYLETSVSKRTWGSIKAMFR
ncbi:MAG TPA: hypothetical protein VI758_10030 [Bacteroidota bacterium]